MPIFIKRPTNRCEIKNRNDDDDGGLVVLQVFKSAGTLASSIFIKYKMKFVLDAPQLHGPAASVELAVWQRVTWRQS